MRFSHFTNPVILNLFQDPSGRKFGASRIGAMPTNQPTTPRSGCWDKWALKQVQGDERREWGA